MRIPREQWPKDGSWEGIDDPVCPLVLALYGHPDSGGYWEQHCDGKLRSEGFEPIKNWRSCYYHKKLKLMLVVYVDDFKLTGPKGSLAAGWVAIRKHIKMELPRLRCNRGNCHIGEREVCPDHDVPDEEVHGVMHRGLP